MKIVVAGGGYAGLSCLMEIADRLPDAERVLVDPSRWHLRQTRLQEALRRSLDGLRTPFSELGDQYGFRHVRASPSLSRKALARASAAGVASTTSPMQQGRINTMRRGCSGAGRVGNRRANRV